MCPKNVFPLLAFLTSLQGIAARCWEVELPTEPNVNTHATNVCKFAIWAKRVFAKCGRAGHLISAQHQISPGDGVRSALLIRKYRPAPVHIKHQIKVIFLNNMAINRVAYR